MIARCLFVLCIQLPVIVFAQAPEDGPKLLPLPHPDIPRPPLPQVPTQWLVVFGGGFLITALVALLLWLLFKMPRLTPPPETPLQKAERLLEALKLFLDQTPPGEISHHVSVILRDYMESRYEVPALARTTPELYERNTSAMLNSLRERFSPLAAMYDRLSFAPQSATREDAVALIESALDALQKEKPPLPPPLVLPLPASQTIPPPFVN